MESGATLTFSAWSVDGAPGSYVAMEASTPGSSYSLVNATAGVFTSTYVIFSDAHASADALWTAGTGCEDWGGNVGLFDADSPVVGDRIFFDPSESYSITGWSVDGSVGAGILITSNPPTASHALIAIAGAPFTSDWCVISHSDVTPEADWTAGGNSFDAGNNLVNGWFGGAATYVDAIGVWLTLGGWLPSAGVTTDARGATASATASSPDGQVNSDAQGATATLDTGSVDASAGGLAVGAVVALGDGLPSTEVHADAAGSGVAVGGQPVGATAGAVPAGALVTLDGSRPSLASLVYAEGAQLALSSGNPSMASLARPAGVVVDVGAQGVGAGVYATTVSSQVSVRTAGRLHTHRARPPIVHATIPRSMGERVISRVTAQVTIAYPIMDKGVSRWRT